MEITLEFTKSLEANASLYYEIAKKYKGKRERALAALQRLKKVTPKTAQVAVKKLWYHAYRWFRSSTGVLCVGGRNAASNESLVKNHMLPDETVMHTTLAGSPFVVIKGKPDETTLHECALATAAWSRAWKQQLKTATIMIVKRSQLKKKGPKGESLPKGSFYVAGSHDEQLVPVGCTIGMIDGIAVCGPEAAIKKHATVAITLTQGTKSKEIIAPTLARAIGCNVDDVLRALPAGEFA